MGPCSEGGGEALTLLAAGLAIALSRGRSADELELLSAFFQVLGDALAMIALRLPADAALPAGRPPCGG